MCSAVALLVFGCAKFYLLVAVTMALALALMALPPKDYEINMTL